MIRPAKLTDLPIIAEIYNDAIVNTTAVFYTDAKDMDFFIEWFNNHDEKHPILVYELDGECVGYVSLSEWSDKCAYDGTQEVSVYVHMNHRGKGIGLELMHAIIAKGKELGLATILSRITQESEGSVSLHKKVGFVEIGNMQKVGFKFGRVLDVLMMQYLY